MMIDSGTVLNICSGFALQMNNVKRWHTMFVVFIWVYTHVFI